MSDISQHPCVVGLVPIKLHSERAPGKNIRPLGDGPPLVELILSTMLRVPEIDATYVYCSDDRIEEFLPAGIRFLRRSPSLDADSTKIGEVLSSFARDIDADLYVLAHATAPFLTAASISSATSSVSSGRYDSALSVRRQQEFTWVDGRPENYDVEEVPRTQDLPIRHIETTGLYVYTRELILDRNRRIGDNPHLVEVSKLESVDINDEDDFMFASAIHAAGIARPSA